MAKKTYIRTNSERQLDRCMRAALGSIIHTQTAINAVMEHAEGYMTEAELANHVAYGELCHYEVESRKAFQALCGELRGRVNSIPGCYPSLVALKDLPPECRELIFSLYGVPHTDMTGDGRTLPEKETSSDISGSVRTLQKEPPVKYRNSGKDCQLSDGNPLQMIESPEKNESIQYHPQSIEKAYASHCVHRRITGCRSLSRSRFYAMWRQSSWHHVQIS